MSHSRLPPGVTSQTLAVPSSPAVASRLLTDPASGAPRPAAVKHATVKHEQKRPTPKRKPTAAKPKPPLANEFAHLFVELTNAYAKEHGDPTRVSHPDCVQASSGHYMCSYATTAPGGVSECHIMQARWTPQRASSFTVTLAGRTERCGSLREALRSLS